MIVDHLEFFVDTEEEVALAAIVSVKGSDAGFVLERRDLGVGVASEDDRIGQVLVWKLRILASVLIAKAGLVEGDVAGPLEHARSLVKISVKLAIAELGRDL